MKYRNAILSTFCKNGLKRGYEHDNHPFLISSELTCKTMKLQAAADSLADYYKPRIKAVMWHTVYF